MPAPADHSPFWDAGVPGITLRVCLAALESAQIACCGWRPAEAAGRSPGPRLSRGTRRDEKCPAPEPARVRTQRIPRARLAGRTAPRPASTPAFADACPDTHGGSKDRACHGETQNREHRIDASRATHRRWCIATNRG